MAKKGFLSGVDKKTRDEIYALRRGSIENAKKVAAKETEKYKEPLLGLQKEFNQAIEDAKKDKLIPQNTNIARIGMLPAKEPKPGKGWASSFNRIFGRKKAKAKPKAASKSIVNRITDAVSTPKPKAKKPTTKKKAPTKK